MDRTDEDAIVFHRPACLRAFRDRAGGWTVISPAGACLQLRTAPSLIVWEALEAGETVGGLRARLAERFPDVAGARLEADLRTFLRSLEANGLVHRAGDASAARRSERATRRPGGAVRRGVAAPMRKC